MFGLDRVHGCAHQRLVDRSQVGLASEDDVGRVLDLHQTPVVSGLHCVEYGTVASGEIVEALVQSRDVEVVCERLRPLEVVDSGERIVEHGEANALMREAIGKPVVAVEVELQAKWRPVGTRR